MRRSFHLLVALMSLLAACSGKVRYNRGASAIRYGDSAKLQRFVERHPDKQPYAAMADDHLAWHRALAARDTLGLPLIEGVEQYIADYPDGIHIDEAHQARRVVSIVHDDSSARTRVAMLKNLYGADAHNPFISPSLARFLDRIAFTTDTMVVEYSDLEWSTSGFGALFSGKIQGKYADYAGLVVEGDVVMVCNTDRISSIDTPNMLNRTLGELFIMTLHEFEENSLESLVIRHGDVACRVGVYDSGETWGWTGDSSKLSLTMPAHLASSSIPSAVMVRRMKTVGGGNEILEKHDAASERRYDGAPGEGIGDRYSSLVGEE